jgi:predicted DNA-binding transcriptional regulator AlpA
MADIQAKQQTRWIDPKQFFIDYGIAESTQAKMRMNGELPYSKIGNKFIRYDRQEIDTWLETHKVTA